MTNKDKMLRIMQNGWWILAWHLIKSTEKCYGMIGGAGGNISFCVRKQIVTFFVFYIVFWKVILVADFLMSMAF